MNWRYVGVLCLVVVALAQCVCFANGATKVEQLPKMEEGFSFASDLQSQMLMADDWVCPDGNPITGIRWWGSYWTSGNPGINTVYSDTLQNASGANPPSFTIYIFSNLPASDPANTLGQNHPGTLLQEYSFTAAECNQTYYGTDVKTRNPDNTPKIYEDVYEYNVSLGGQNPAFNQVKDETYWLAILANDTNDPNNARQWGWHEGNGAWGERGMQLLGMTDGPRTGVWMMPCGGHDMAFQLTTEVPEPGSLYALAAGLVGLAGFTGRSRRSK